MTASRPRPPTYASVYNALFTLSCRSRRDAWVMRRLRHNCSVVRARVGAHVVQLARTQSRARWMIGTEVVARAQDEVRLGTIARKIAARRIQTRVVRHVWRPGGVLFRRHIPHDFVTN